MVPSSPGLTHRDGCFRKPTVAKRHRDGGPRLVRLRQIGEFVHGLRVGAPGLLHQERSAALDQEPERRRHGRVMAQSHDELRLRLVQHQAVIRVRRAAVLSGPFRGDAGVRSMDAEDVELLALKDPEVIRRRGRVVVIDADDGDALRPLSSLLSARVVTPERPEQGLPPSARRPRVCRCVRGTRRRSQPDALARCHPNHPFFGTKARNRRGLSTVMRRIVSSFTPASRSFGTKTVSVLP